MLGRSHRSPLGLGRLQLATQLIKASHSPHATLFVSVLDFLPLMLQYPRLQFLLIYFLTHQETLELPVGYEVAVVTGSNTAAFEMAMWNLLGERDVHCVHFEAFGKNWYVDAAEQLKLSVTQHTCAYGQLPDLSRVNFDADVMMTWNGTTSGVCMPDDVSVIPVSRKGLTLVDATSAVFAMPMPWAACDVTTFSWQKALGGEGAHGVIVMSPRAMQRLREYTPPWPVPKLFRMKSGGKVEDALFKGSVLNTVARSAPLYVHMHLFLHFLVTFSAFFRCATAIFDSFFRCLCCVLKMQLMLSRG